MESHPWLMQSYSGMDEKSQETVKFTQAKMEYNQGWLVQGEAPPGALFKTFRNLVVQGGVSSADVAFYFVHWLTDLAGAEPTPLEGCEKFVLKFPHHVLRSFVQSFSFVQRLTTRTET